VPPDVETALSAAEAEAEANGDSVFGVPYQYPPAYPQELSLKERVALEKDRSRSQGAVVSPGEKKRGYEPVRHENTGMDSEEALYESHLLSVPEALERLEGIPVMQHVVRVGWEGIVKRLSME